MQLFFSFNSPETTMKFSTTLALTVLSATALADSEAFVAQTLRTGTDVHHGSITVKDGALTLNSGDAPPSYITDEGAWKIGNQYVKVADQGVLTLVNDLASATKTFYIKDQYISPSEGFTAKKVNDKFVLRQDSKGPEEAGAIPFAIRPLSKAHPDSPVPDFTPPKAAPASAPAPAAPAKTPVQPASQIDDGQVQATTKTPAPPAPAKTPAQPVSQIGDGQVQATTKTTPPTFVPQTANGAGQLVAGAAGLLAAGALLL